MKKRISLIILSCLALIFLMPAQAQDARQRTVSTIVQDALALLPARTAEDLAEPVGDLAASAPESIEILAGMMAPSDKGLNNKIEYALNGVVNHVAADAGAQYRDAVCKGLTDAIKKSQDPVNTDFLLSRLALVAGTDCIPVFAEYAENPEHASVAIGALAGIDGSEDALLSLIAGDKASRPLLAYAAAEKGMEAAEPYIMGWLEELAGNTEEDSDATSPSDTPDYRTYCHALALCGTAASARMLEKYSVDDYMILLGRLAVTDSKTAIAGAKKYLKNAETDIRCSALSALATAQGADARKTLFAALKDNDREYRNAALEYAAIYSNEAEFCGKIEKLFPKLGEEAQTDIVNWAGTNTVSGLLDLVLATIPEAEASGNEELAVAAIAAAGKLGGDASAAALAARLEGAPASANAAYRALLSFNGNIGKDIRSALEGNSQSKVYAMKIASLRRMHDLAPAIFGLLDADDNAVKSTAYTALQGVVSAGDADRINGLLAGAEDADTIGKLQAALCSALASLSPEERFNAVNSMMQGTADKTKYYPVVAFSGTKGAVAMLDKEYSAHPDAAFKALKTVGNLAAADVLYRIAGQDAARKDEALSRFTDLIAAAQANDLYKVERLDAAMALEPSAAVRNKVLNVLANIPTLPAFDLAAKYLDNKETSYAAAAAVKTIVSKTEDEIDYYALKSALEKARDVYAASWGADNGYAVDEINKMLGELQAPAPKFELPEDEAKAGYEVLFDGTDMSQWTGDLRRYSLINGTIYVTANYGNANNLYTKKEYSDFILRFEFCFETPGVNNGVGIRTPKDVDAAYYGMCECQILDHDDPIYKDLNVYQVHGSAYGIIPAKRIVHKPLGTWNQEEIKVVGDHITVTLNGEVILDGNLREACKGHNVAPDGSDYNPYTVDHRNHPGMFNEKGYISLCGHGPGIRFRNIRVLDLSK